MVKCAYCKNDSRFRKGISFHQFPIKQQEREKWIKNMGRENWVPTKYSTLCANHFTSNCIEFRVPRSRLRKGSIPTIFENGGNSHTDSNTNKLIEDVETEVNELLTSVINFIVSVDDQPVEKSRDHFSTMTQKIRGIPRDHSHNVNSKMEVRDRNNFSIGGVETEVSELLTNSIVSVHDQHVEKSSDDSFLRCENRLGIPHDHTYNVTNEALISKVEILEEKSRKLRKELNNKRVILKRYKRKACRMKETIEYWENRELIDKKTLLENFGDIPTQIFDRIYNNGSRDEACKEKYPRELRDFALTLYSYSPAAYQYVRETFQKALPHPNQLRSWNKSENAEPGVSEERFDALQLKPDENEELFGSFMVDEISVKHEDLSSEESPLFASLALK